MKKVFLSMVCMANLVLMTACGGGNNNAIKTAYCPHRNEAVSLIDCKYFTTALLHLDTPCQRSVAQHDSFVVYMCLQGAVTIATEDGTSTTLKQGETCLVPAAISHIVITPTAEAKLLEVYVP